MHLAWKFFVNLNSKAKGGQKSRGLDPEWEALILPTDRGGTAQNIGTRGLSNGHKPLFTGTG